MNIVEAIYFDRGVLFQQLSDVSDKVRAYFTRHFISIIRVRNLLRRLNP